MMSRLLLIFSFLEAAVAQSSPNPGYVYAGDSLQTADIAINSLYVLTIGVTFIASIISVSKTHTQHMSYIPSLVLSVTLFFAFVTLVFDLASLIMEANSTLNFYPANAYVAVFGLSLYIYSWTMSLLFLAFSLILLSVPIGTSKLMTLSSAGYFVLLIILASIEVAFYISYYRAVFLLDGFQALGDLSRRLLRYENMLYVFNSFLYATVIGVAVMLYRRHYTMRRLGGDTPSSRTRNIAFHAYPPYVLLILAQVAFTIVNSPAGQESPKNESSGDAVKRLITRSEMIALIHTNLIWGLFTATCIALLVVVHSDRKRQIRVADNNDEFPLDATRKWYQRPAYGLDL